MNNLNEKKEVLKSIRDGIENINLYIDGIANKFYEGHEKIACEGLAFVSEELGWVFKGLELTSDVLNTDKINNIIIEHFNVIVEGLENEDYILVADIFNYEVKPLLENLIKGIEESIQ